MLPHGGQHGGDVGHDRRHRTDTLVGREGYDLIAVLLRYSNNRPDGSLIAAGIGWYG